MASLADEPDDLIFPTDTIPPMGWTILGFSLSTILASYSDYYLTLRGKLLGSLVRQQLRWCINTVTLDGSLASFSTNSSIGEVMSLLGSDTAQVEWALGGMVYAVVSPIEAVVMVVLACLSIGIEPCLAGLIPLSIYLFPVKLLLLQQGQKYQAKARNLQSERLNISNDGIANNGVLKYLGTEELILDRVKEMRKKEERYMIPMSLSNATSLAGQVMFLITTHWCLLSNGRCLKYRETLSDLIKKLNLFVWSLYVVMFGAIDDLL